MMKPSIGSPAPRTGQAIRSDGIAGQSPSVLIVDDEPVIVDVLALLLEDEGFVVRRAYDGEQAWHLVVGQRPDLVISDLSMPRLGGLGLFRRLREEPALARIPVILMSASQHGIDVPGVAFLPKPFDFDYMLSLVQAELAVR